VRRAWERLVEADAILARRLLNSRERMVELARVWACSDFVASSCARDPSLLVELFDAVELEQPANHLALRERVRAQAAQATDADGLGASLRRIRRRDMVRIAWRDLTGRAGLGESLRDLTQLAECCLQEALARLHQWEVERFGEPRNADGGAQQLVVLGMGKLGGGELNFSSDIDLILGFPENGETDGRRPVSNEEFFRRLGQKLAGLLDQVTDLGFVFRVDLRLRPFGDSGPLVATFSALEQYYQTHGRDWERYAMIKARPVAGDLLAGERLLESLRPFVYRRYLDYGALAALREMKRMIVREVERKGLRRNVKLGPGGIREIEFIAQAFQLIYGGRRPVLRERSTLGVLDALGAGGYLPKYVVAALKEAYCFLRLTENRLQAHADQQLHDLPHEELPKLRLAYAMGFDTWPAFVDALMRHVRRVEGQFEQVFAAPQGDDQGDGAAGDFAAVWDGGLSDEAARSFLTEQGFEQPDEVERLLAGLQSSLACRSLSTRGRDRLDQLMPLLLGAVAGAPHPTQTLDRLLRLVERVARRSVYLSMLVENPLVLSQLVKLCAASPWIAEHLARHPLLMDELMHPSSLYQPLRPDALLAELDLYLSRISPADQEQRLDAFRHFQQINVLRVAAADINGGLRLMLVSDCLTWIAEAVLRRVLEYSWTDLVARHGVPRYIWEGEIREAGFAIVAYGKLGGIELGYGSDLDLVFLHDSCADGQETDGARCIDNGTFFARLAQRIIHHLSTRTAAGVLYEVDTRLRPSGRAGLLVTSLEAFTRYQREEAWTWEHQALVRARPVAGTEAIAEALCELRRTTLSQPRDRQKLRTEVREMRERMRQELGSKKGGGLDLKHDRGGIADIEFMVQYAVLAGACDYPALLEWTDNIRQLDALEAASLLSAEDASCLRDAYRALRRLGHRLTLEGRDSSLTELELGQENQRHREAVARLWRQMMETDG
jgi:glutamate-ammonia-ligase adenylyltransferase